MNSRCYNKRSKPCFEMVALASFWWARLWKKTVLVDEHPLELMCDDIGIGINDKLSWMVSI